MPEMVETEKNSVTKRRPPAPLFHVLYCFAFPGGICYNDPVREVISMQAYDRISRYKGALMGIMILIVVYGIFYLLKMGTPGYYCLVLFLGDLGMFSYRFYHCVKYKIIQIHDPDKLNS